MLPLVPVAFTLAVGGLTAYLLREGAERGLRRIVEGVYDPEMVRRAALQAGGMGLGLVVLGSVFGSGWVAGAAAVVGVALVAAGATGLMVDYEIRRSRVTPADLLFGPEGQAPGGGSSP